MAKGSPKQKVNNPGSRQNGTSVIYKQPPAPKPSNALGKQQALTPIGIVNKISKDKRGDLVKPANPNAMSIPAMGIEMHFVDGDKFAEKYKLEDGSIIVLPKKKRTY